MNLRLAGWWAVAALTMGALPAVADTVPQPSFTATTIPALSNAVVNSVHLADLNGDGIPDLVTTENSSQLVIRYLDTSGQVTSVFRVSSVGIPPVAAGFGDFNEDGRTDMVVVTPGNRFNTGGVFLLLQNQDGTFGSPFCCGLPYQGPQPFATFQGGQDAIIGDVNGDGRPDLLVPSNTGGDRLFLGNGAGFSPPIVVSPSTFNDAHAQLADVNGDGALDLVTNNEADPTLSWSDAAIGVRLGLGDGTFGPPTLLHANLFNQSLATGDLNGDGLADIVAAGVSFLAGNHYVAAFLARAGGGFAPPIRLGGKCQTNVCRVALADFNGDGMLDIASTPGYFTNRIDTFLNDGAGGFTQGPSLPGQAFSLAAGAVRLDGTADIFAGTPVGAILEFQSQPAADTTPPDVTVPDPITVEADGPDGAQVFFLASASDDTDGLLSPVCDPVSGSIFRLGATTVSCSATDAAGNRGSATFTVTVVDTTAPSLTVPDGITMDATGPGGVPISFAATATDRVDGAVPVTCVPPSGATFGIGQTSVTCTAGDSHGNVATATFVVHVRGADAQLADLWAAVQSVGPGHSLAAKIGGARAAYAAGDASHTCAMLGAFINEVMAQSGKHVRPAIAADLLARAARIRHVLGC